MLFQFCNVLQVCYKSKKTSIHNRSQVRIPLLHCRVQPLASCLHTCASVIKQYNLVPANGAAVEVTANLAEGIGSLPPGLWLQSPAG